MSTQRYHISSKFLATLNSLIKDLLPDDVRMSCQSSDLIIQLTMSYLNILSDTANNVCNEEGKKTITPSHVAKALKVSICILSREN